MKEENVLDDKDVKGIRRIIADTVERETANTAAMVARGYAFSLPDDTERLLGLRLLTPLLRAAQAKDPGLEAVLRKYATREGKDIILDCLHTLECR